MPRFRARSPQALERRVAALKASPFAIGWAEDEFGHGPAFRCHDPDGHVIELYYETQWYEAQGALKPALKNQAQRYPGARRQRPPPRPFQRPRSRHQGETANSSKPTSVHG